MLAVVVAVVEGNVYKALRNNMQDLQIELIGFVRPLSNSRGNRKENLSKQRTVFRRGTKSKTILKTLAVTLKKRN